MAIRVEWSELLPWIGTFTAAAVVTLIWLVRRRKEKREFTEAEECLKRGQYIECLRHLSNAHENWQINTANLTPKNMLRDIDRLIALIEMTGEATTRLGSPVDIKELLSALKGLDLDGLLAHRLRQVPGLLFGVRGDFECRHGSGLSLGIHRHEDVVRAGTELTSAQALFIAIHIDLDDHRCVPRVHHFADGLEHIAHVNRKEKTQPFDGGRHGTRVTAEVIGRDAGNRVHDLHDPTPEHIARGVRFIGKDLSMADDLFGAFGLLGHFGFRSAEVPRRSGS